MLTEEADPKSRAIAGRVRRWLVDRRRTLGPIAAMVVILLIDRQIADLLSHNLDEILLRFGDLEPEQIQPTGGLPWFRIGLVSTAVAGWLLGFQRVSQVVIYLFIVLATLMLSASVLVLGVTVPIRSESSDAAALLGDAAWVWLLNWLIFALWYWLLDSGAAYRPGDAEERRRDLLFPQQSHDLPGWRGWQPRFVDYLYVAFSLNLTFGPSDTLILSRRAKVLVMVQAAHSAITILFFASRALNILA